jgi:hypothetical protein
VLTRYLAVALYVGSTVITGYLVFEFLSVNPIVAEAETAGVGEVGQSVGLASYTNPVQKLAR